MYTKLSIEEWNFKQKYSVKVLSLKSNEFSHV